MVAETAQHYEALSAQARALIAIFGEAGYEAVAPSILQPADVFLDRVGEAIRARTYVFTDLDGDMLCLRPDLTVPVCRLYLERHPEADAEARYCYNGSAFRYQSDPQDAVQPREFRQAGIELIGAAEGYDADAEVFGLALEAVRKSGLAGFQVHLGDLEMFEALIGAIEMPDRWRNALWHTFWRPPAFHALLRRLSDENRDGTTNLPTDLMAKLDPEDLEAAEQSIAAYLDGADIPVAGTRTLREITERLLDHAADSREATLPESAVALIEDYLAISGPPRAAAARIADLARSADIDLDAGLERFLGRIDRLDELDIDINTTEFGAVYGRSIEYYTGFVFQIEIPERGRAGQIAGGGRYDGLMSELGSPERVPAVGCAIHTERLLAAVGGGGS